MTKQEYFQIAAREIKSLGFRVFVHKNTRTNDNYLFGYYSDGANIGYFQLADFGGVSLSSVNKPGSFCSGFGITESGVFVEDLTTEKLRAAFVAVPRWYRMTAYDARRGGVKKYANLEDFLNTKYFSNITRREELTEI